MLAEYPKRLFNGIALSALVQDSTVAPGASLGSRVRFYRSSIGRCSFVGYGSTIESCDIGAFCSVSSDCRIGGASHPIEHVSSSPCFYTADNACGYQYASFEFDPYKRTLVGNDVWIGSNVLVKAGVKIGNGAVVGMGSVVTKDIGPFEIWAGNPARFIRSRFSADVAKALEQLAWWEWTDEELRIRHEMFEASSAVQVVDMAAALGLDGLGGSNE